MHPTAGARRAGSASAVTVRRGQPISVRLHFAPMPTTPVATTLALKEWSAVAHALLDGRQTVLLRKGGIHEKAFAVGDADGHFVLFPTVAHSHAERVRPEHADLLARGEADVDETTGAFVVRCGMTLVDVVEVERPAGLQEIADLHIWTAESVKADRLDFRPRHPLQALIVRAVVLPQPRRLVRAAQDAGCRSWIDLPLEWDPAAGHQVHTEQRLAADAQRVRAAVAAEGSDA